METVTERNGDLDIRPELGRLVTQVTWDVMLCQWTSSSLISKDCSALILTLHGEGAVIR